MRQRHDPVRRVPADLGVSDGKLAPCPSSPNCVSSQAEDPGHRVDPLPFEGEATAALQRVRVVLEGWPRTTIVESSAGYIRAECRTRLMRYIDDLELLVDEANRVIHVRSASRVGHSDFGANRRRVEALGAALR